MTRFHLTLILTSALASMSTQAEDKGFRWDSGDRKCYNAQKEEGLNPEFSGQCGQWIQKNFTNEFSNGEFQGTRIESSTFQNGKMEYADLQGLTSKSNRMENTSFYGSKLLWSLWEDSNLRGSDLSYVAVDGSQFKNSDLRNTRLTGASLNGVGFAAVHLDRADLQDAYMVGAQLITTTLNNALLCGTDMSNVQVVRSTFRGAIYDSSTRLPFSEQEAQKQGMTKDNCQQH